MQANAARPADCAYSEASIADLCSRFEVPDSKNRWERPLFRLSSPADLAEQLQVLP